MDQILFLTHQDQKEPLNLLLREVVAVDLEVILIQVLVVEVLMVDLEAVDHFLLQEVQMAPVVLEILHHLHQYKDILVVLVLMLVVLMQVLVEVGALGERELMELVV
jgi:hypothetical protein